MFKKISVGLDGSDSSLNALDYAVHLASQDKAELYIISAVEPLPPMANQPEGPPSYMPQVEEAIRKSTESMQNMHLKQLQNAYPDLKVKNVVQEGRAATVIIEKSRDSDLIVIGHRGQGGVLSWLLGSVAKEITDRCTGPLLIVKDKNYC